MRQAWCLLTGFSSMWLIDFNVVSCNIMLKRGNDRYQPSSLPIGEFLYKCYLCMSARTRPRALCPSCGAYQHDESVIGNSCNASDSQPPCDGVWEDRMRLSDWTSCHTCGGSGYINGKRCTECLHSGWIPHR